MENTCNKQQKGACFKIITARFVQNSTKLALLVGAILFLLVATENVSSDPVSASMNGVVASSSDDVSRQPGSYNNLGKF